MRRSAQKCTNSYTVKLLEHKIIVLGVTYYFTRYYTSLNFQSCYIFILDLELPFYLLKNCLNNTSYWKIVFVFACYIVALVPT